MSKPVIAVNIVVRNGERYIRGCLDSVLAQTLDHRDIELNILDNGSSDQTIGIIEEYLPRFDVFAKTRFIKTTQNLGMWGGQEELLSRIESPLLTILSVDVILEKDFLKHVVELFERHPACGALQAKIYQYTAGSNLSLALPRKIIDTCGFQIFRSRRIANIGHGEEDRGQFNEPGEIFGVEGAVPVVRTEAMRGIRVGNEIADHDLFWYAEDLDVAWRLRLAGWGQRFEPSLIAWHDRQTTKRTSQRSFKNFVSIRREIPLHKRQLEWRNIRCTIVKNDYIINLLKDLPYWLPREIAMTGYLLIFEPQVLIKAGSLIKLLPKMISKRHQILGGAKAGPDAIHKFFI